MMPLNMAHHFQRVGPLAKTARNEDAVAEFLGAFADISKKVTAAGTFVAERVKGQISRYFERHKAVEKVNSIHDEMEQNALPFHNV